MEKRTRSFTLEDTQCLFVEPRGETPAIQAIIKHFERLREAADMPVVLKECFCGKTDASWIYPQAY